MVPQGEGRESHGRLRSNRGQMPRRYVPCKAPWHKWARPSSSSVWQRKQGATIRRSKEGREGCEKRGDAPCSLICLVLSLRLTSTVPTISGRNCKQTFLQIPSACACKSLSTLMPSVGISKKKLKSIKDKPQGGFSPPFPSPTKIV